MPAKTYDDIFTMPVRSDREFSRLWSELPEGEIVIFVDDHNIPDKQPPRADCENFQDGLGI